MKNIDLARECGMNPIAGGGWWFSDDDQLDSFAERIRSSHFGKGAEMAPMTPLQVNAMVNGIGAYSGDYEDAIVRAVERQHEAQRQAGQPSDDWKDAIIHELTLTCMDAPQDEAPASILKRVIDWHVALERDPAMRQAGQEPVQLQHMAVAENGNLRWMTGRKMQNCELYAMPGGKNAPKLYATSKAERQPPTDAQIEDAITNWFAEDWAIEKARGLLHDLGIRAVKP